MDELAPFSPPPNPGHEATASRIRLMHVVTLVIVGGTAVALLVYFLTR